MRSQSAKIRGTLEVVKIGNFSECDEREDFHQWQQCQHGDGEQPAQGHHHTQEPEDRVCPGGHHRPQDGGGEAVHEGEGKAEGGTEGSLASSDI